MEYINKLLLRAAAIPARTSPTPPSGNDSSLQKTAEHEVKVRFAREFADVGSIGYSVPESLSSASSFQSLSSTLSTKSSSGICPDSVPQSPDQISNTSYANPTIPDVDDLIHGCAGIKINNDEDTSYSCLQDTQDLSQDQTFASATDEPIADLTRELVTDSSLVESCNVTQIIETGSCSAVNLTQDLQDRPILLTPVIQTEEPTEKPISPSENNDLIPSLQTSSFDDVEELPLPPLSTEESNLHSTVCLSSDFPSLDASRTEKLVVDEDIQIRTDSVIVNTIPCAALDSVTSVSTFTEHVEDLSLPSLPTLTSLHITDSSRQSENDAREADKSSLAELLSPVNDSNVAITEQPKNSSNNVDPATEDNINKELGTISSDFCDAAISRESCTNLLNETSLLLPRTPEKTEENLETSEPVETESEKIVSDIVVTPKVDSFEVVVTPLVEKEVEEVKSDDFVDAPEVLETINVIESVKEVKEDKELSNEKLDRTLTFEDALLDAEIVPVEEQYNEFKPQRQSTTLALPTDIEQPNFDELKSAAEQIANDIFKSSLELPEESDRFVTATSDIFQDPTSFDFLIAHGNSRTKSRLRAQSLYVKFDPLVGDTSMLPQGNTEPINDEEQNGKTESPPPSICTPKRNPAIAAIDRLLFYSPITTGMTPKMEEPKEKIEQATDEPKSDTPLMNDVNMSKELELVRATVLQLEEELEKQKKDHKAELERQKNAFQEKINQLQTQMAQEVKSTSQMTVVVEEYEKSISRLLTERERDRTNFEQEKAKLQEELQATNVHLSNTEAAFNDVHQKYEKVKGVVSVYKNNEIVLREGIQENMETIKCLQTRYDSLKNHAASQLEKANSDLENIRKQHEDEIVKLHAMVRKAELKSNSLAELVEQKAKENKELTQILDEVIARVGHQNAE
ncbi:transforming acidic coiled-coil protein isoform X2 [Nomia melanderi]|uniref:transforming acidic coiled-coil protein isoform X2 n=1 Tax=Nomia melanderi TaxID=2448451 RepID=UPI003FCDFC8F